MKSVTGGSAEVAPDFRPQNSEFSGITAQVLAKSILEAALRRNRFPSFLFSGPAGVGKRTLALMFAQAVNCKGTSPTDDGGGLFGAPPPAPPPSTLTHGPCRTCPDCRQIAALTHPDVKFVMPLKCSLRVWSHGRLMAMTSSPE